ncbi:MAG: T9SS type A sorting domain-containing protein [Bacteroidota bacterium]
MQKIVALLFTTLSFICFSQNPELVYSENNLHLRAVTGDSLNYYYFETNNSTLNSIDQFGAHTVLTTVPNVSASFQSVIIFNKGKGIFGNSSPNGTFYYLYNGVEIDTLYESNAELKNDRIIIGDYVYYHDTKNIYKTNLNSVDEFQVLYNFPLATDFYGISNFYLFDNKIIFSESGNGESSTKSLNLAGNQITTLFSNDNISKSSNSIILIEDPYFSSCKVWEMRENTPFELIYDGTLHPFQYSITKFSGKLGETILFDGHKNGVQMLLKLENGVLSPLNHGTDANSYPTFVNSTYQAGNYVYFMAGDTNSVNYDFQIEALWVTDGTLSGTRKMINNPSPDLPEYLNLFNTSNNSNINCYNDLWIGYNSDKLVHLNAESNLIESFTNYKNVDGFYSLSNNDIAYFHSGDVFGDRSINKISCSGSLAIKEIDLFDFKLFPNPTNENIYLDFEDKLNVEIAIFDLNGNKLYQAKNAQKNTEINLDKFASGMYIIEMKNESFNAKKRFIKE